jgi:hypothetical protein
MTLDEALHEAYRWGDENAALIFLASVGLPLVGALAALVGKGGKSDQDGRVIASLVLGAAMLLVGLEVAACLAATKLADLRLLDANALLLLSPLACLATAVIGLRKVFPLTQLGSMRTAIDLGVFFAAAAGAAWLISRFHWGVLFRGSVAQLAVVVALAVVVLIRLWRRATRSEPAEA